MAFLAGNEHALDAAGGVAETWLPFRDKLRAEQGLVIIAGSEVTGEGIASLVKFARDVPGAKVICLADYSNSRGAADMGLYPDLLPGYHRVADKRQVPRGVGRSSDGYPGSPCPRWRKLRRPARLKPCTSSEQIRFSGLRSIRLHSEGVCRSARHVPHRNRANRRRRSPCRQRLRESAAR